MEDEEIRKKIRRAIFTAFDKWGSQNFDVLFDSNTRKENPEKFSAYRLDNDFMIRRVHDIGFFRYVAQQVVASKDCQRQLRTLTRAAILSILHPTISVGELEKKSGDENPYTRRNLQDLVRRTYSETFFEASKDIKEKTIPDTVKPYSTVFSPFVEPKLDNPRIVGDIQAMDRITWEGNPKLMEEITLNAQMQIGIPEYLQNFYAFLKLCRELLASIGDYSQTGKILVQELGDVTETLNIFHNHMLSIVSIEWYRSRREERRKKMLREPHPLTYSREDAALTSKYHLEWSGSEELTANIISQLCVAFRQNGRHDICVLFFGECIKFGSLSPLYKGVLHENLATALRDIDPPRPKHMVREMKKALEFYRASRQLYRVCVGLKNLGEAEWKLGYKDLAMDYFDQAKAQSQELEQSDRANVLVNLAVAAMRVGDRTLEIRYLGECLKECPEDWTEKILRINERLTELTR